MYPEMIGESVRGEKHVQSDRPCQDNWNGVVTDEYLITSVADGLGSSRKSAVGSEIAVETAVSTFQEWASNNPEAIANIDTEAIQDAFGDVYSAARNEIKKVAEGEEGSSVDEYHTTLSIVIATSDWYAAGAVGDSGMVGIDLAGKAEKLVGREDSSVSSSTVPITGSPKLIEERKRFNIEEKPLAAVVSFSDGFDRFAWDKGDSSQPRTKFFNRIAKFIVGVDSFNQAEARNQFDEFVNSDVFNRHSSDDRTLVIGRFPSNVSSDLIDSTSKQVYDDSEFVQAVRNLSQDEAYTAAVADRVGCSRPTAADRLRILEVLGDVESVSQANKIVWIETAE